MTGGHQDPAQGPVNGPVLHHAPADLEGILVPPQSIVGFYHQGQQGQGTFLLKFLFQSIQGLEKWLI